MTPRILLGLFVALGSGCGGYNVAYTFLNAPPHHITPRAPLAVEVFTPTSPPPRPFVEIGIVEAHANDDYSNDDRSAIMLALRREAGRRGCEAIIAGEANETQTTFAPVGRVVVGSSNTLHGFRGTCVVFR